MLGEKVLKLLADHYFSLFAQDEAFDWHKLLKVRRSFCNYESAINLHLICLHSLIVLADNGADCQAPQPKVDQVGKKCFRCDKMQTTEACTKARRDRRVRANTQLVDVMQLNRSSQKVWALCGWLTMDRNTHTHTQSAELLRPKGPKIPVRNSARVRPKHVNHFVVKFRSPFSHFWDGKKAAKKWKAPQAGGEIPCVI